MSEEVDAICDAIAENAADNIASVSVAGQSVSTKDVSQQIEAAQFAANKNAVANRVVGWRQFKFRPPGCG